ncbi:MAG: BCCT family transporter [Corynebacterium glucuronolyticum]|nr:BCCT family transporter [Mycobacteriaceae bacterium]MDY5834005.1 BCCT family transporter [Corynebacterium glucuronolyticum]
MRFVGEASSGTRTTHPGLIPGIGVERTGVSYPTKKWVFVIALAPTGNITLGEDGEEPDYFRAAWISMLFAAGLGIGLSFYGPMEPMQHFISAPPASDAPSGDPANVLPAVSQALLHQTLFTWGIYALVGGAIAYASYRHGRLPLISALFEPVFPDGPHHFLGRVVDIFAVLVTLFGTATSLGIGALQIQAGAEIVTGLSLAGNQFLIGCVSVLTCVFILSAVSGVKKGLRILSNMNMFLVILLGVMWCWAVDLRNDPYTIHRHYARGAIAQGVRRGIEQHGDDFIFGAEGVDPEHGAGAKTRYESEDPQLSEWYTEYEGPR